MFPVVQWYFPGAAQLITWNYIDQPADAPLVIGLEHRFRQQLKCVYEGPKHIYDAMTFGYSGSTCNIANKPKRRRDLKCYLFTALSEVVRDHMPLNPSERDGIHPLRALSSYLA